MEALRSWGEELLKEYDAIVSNMPKWEATPSIEEANAWACRVGAWLGGPFAGGDVHGGFNGWLASKEGCYGETVPQDILSLEHELKNRYDTLEQQPKSVGDYIVARGGYRGMPCP
ncbi:MAG: hypothetical protein OXE02_03220 [Chloroflexi bacterium]|nr:hypothetical protein [Chloroflexota bacterium]